MVFLPLLFVLICNMFLYEINYDESDIRKQAAEWQLHTKGVVAPPPNWGVIDNHPITGQDLFKILVLKARLPKINTLVFGSSTVMGIQANMFPKNMSVYSFTHSGQTISESIAKGEYFKNVPGIKWLIIDLDWYLGYLYHPYVNFAFVFSSKTTVMEKGNFISKLKDALSLPRIKSLLDVFLEIAGAKDKKDAFLKIFKSNYIGTDYQCRDGTPAKDFDRAYIKRCIGFRNDGSAAWDTMPHLDQGSLEFIMHAPLGVYYLNDYFSPFNQAKGIPNSELLQKLADLALVYKKKGGGVIFVLPGLPPYYEKSLLKNPLTAPYLKNTKRNLSHWSKQHNIIIIDAGQSENFQCQPQEFLDDHHAYDTCYAKIFNSFWSDYKQHLVSAGLYSIPYLPRST